MANNPQETFVAGDAVISVNFDVEGFDISALPEYVDEELVDFDSLGLVSDSGETLSRAVTTSSLNAHQQSNVRTLVTEGTMTFNVECLESNATARRLYFGADFSNGSYTDIDPTSITYVIGVLDAFDTQEGFEKAVRYSALWSVVPNGDVVYQRGDAARLPLTFTAVSKVRYTDTSQGS